MNILIVTTRLPYPMNNGAKIRAFHVLKALAEKHKVTLLSFYGSATEEQHFHVFDSLGVTLVPILNPAIDRPVGWKDLFRSIDSGLPLTVGKYFDSRMAKAIADHISGSDVIHCEHMHMAQYLFNIKHLPKVLDAHNVESQIAERLALGERNPLKKLILKWNFSRMQRYEKKIAEEFNMILPVSSQDLHVFETDFGAKCVRLLENGVDVEYFSPSERVVQEKMKKLVFVGAMDWMPNSDGIKHFVADILPLIKKECPQVKLSVVGKDPSEEVRQLSRVEGVQVTGTVDDVRPYVWDSQAYIVPLRFGGGTRLKILEAFAAGKPVVSTGLGCEGIECRNGEELLIADTPADFAAAVVRLLRDQDYCERLTRNARKLAVSTYSWDVICSKLITYYDELLLK